MCFGCPPAAFGYQEDQQNGLVSVQVRVWLSNSGTRVMPACRYAEQQLIMSYATQCSGINHLCSPVSVAQLRSSAPAEHLSLGP